MRTLKEINAERTGIIEEAVKNLYRGAARGIPYTPEELSALTGCLIPPENFEKVLRAAFHEIEKNGHRRWSGARYYLYSRVACKLVEDERKLTYKVYDERGDLINEFTRHKRVIKAEIL
jgi:hypothetical protein